MKNFSFCNPTKIEFGIDKEKQIGKYMKDFNVKKTLILYGSERIKQNGLFDTTTNSLNENDIKYEAIGGIKSNPILSKVKEAINVAKELNVDSILAIGGGSVLDSAKAVAAGACYDGDVWDFFTKTKPKTALKIFDIITLAATGSEMNGGSVITNDITNQKYSFSSPVTFPTLSVINPDLHKTVSKEYLAYSAADVIAHCIEGYFTAKYHPTITRMYIESNIKSIIKNTEILLKNPDDYNARAEFAWAATMSLNGLSQLGVDKFYFPNHMIEHAMSAITDCPHGAGLSVIMPAWMMWYKDQNLDAFKRFAKEIFNKESAKDGITSLKEWFNKINTPTSLKQLNIDNDTLEKIIQNAFENSKRAKMNDVYNQNSIKEIFDFAK
ncbi:iron-containing alcohol dehydrogenase [Campylobacter pinnipediorum]|uniref:iron-containing alcohol dehydrogenase n=1 Tax=Campylobacter pinnipediorum TaxID=1965231 RepID=UPI00084D7378|nr:iron-containing alcohol dehydrogenase [Campylobacter pinnipediorum]